MSYAERRLSGRKVNRVAERESDMLSKR